MSDDIKLEQERTRGVEAGQLLNNRIFREVLQQLNRELDQKADAVKTTDMEACQDIIRCKQLLSGLERIIVSYAETGKMARMAIEMLLKRNKPKIFSRF